MSAAVARGRADRINTRCGGRPGGRNATAVLRALRVRTNGRHRGQRGRLTARSRVTLTPVRP